MAGIPSHCPSHAGALNWAEHDAPVSRRGGSSPHLFGLPCCPEAQRSEQITAAPRPINAVADRADWCPRNMSPLSASAACNLRRQRR